jgi:hypothetical protein
LSTTADNFECLRPCASLYDAQSLGTLVAAFHRAIALQQSGQAAESPASGFKRDSGPTR